ncbi:MAG: DNA-3-methyladenine glycosylase [Bacteroidales bacterium]|nr:DNA-3-methyladenine glycosylase [Bacteroidales bacterium]
MLPHSFYLQPDVVSLARDLLGKRLSTRIEGEKTSGIITETEAYAGITDRASHAFGGRKTRRTEIMYVKGGTAYVYLCYGMHSLFNVVTNQEGIPHAVLIRAIEPFEGIEIMKQRRKKEKIGIDFSNGPGKVTEALGIHFSYSGLDLTQIPSDSERPAIWIEDVGKMIPADQILVTPRIGVGYAGEDASLPYRFLLKKDGPEKK